MAQKQSSLQKAEMRLTFKLDRETSYKLKDKAKALKIAFPAYLRQCVLRGDRIAQ